MSYLYSNHDKKCGNEYDENNNNNEIFNSYAVQVNDLVYAYSSGDTNRVLNKCSINVPKGKIYALLGSSGCGKTTLINCIIGKLRPQSGEITAFGVRANSLMRNKLGFMPQEISLFTDFTIEENLRYFARLYGMTNDSITNRIDKFIEFLNLPDKGRVVSKLSGGQKRRVSLCVALIHSPMLVILDEPTVGVDPLLRHAIWNYLEMICDVMSITVIITTHYIEEARNASTVAYLRDGQIIVEQNPEILLSKYNCDKLEDVFLELCENNKTEIMEKKNEVVNPNDSENFINDSEILFYLNMHSKFTQFGAHVMKNLLQSYRTDRHINIFCVLMPTISMLIFYMFIAKNGIKFSLSIYNNDSNDDNFSSDYISSIDSKQFNINRLNSEQSLINSVIDGKTKVGISISSNFSENLKHNFNKLNDDTTNINTESSIKVYLEMIEVLDMLIMPELYKTYLNVAQHYLSSIGLNPSLATPPFEQINIYDTSHLSIFDYTIPGFLTFGVFIISLSTTVQSTTKEKAEGVLERSIIAGVNSFSYYFALFATKFAYHVPYIVLFMAILYPIFSESNLFLLYGLFLLNGLSGITSGLLLSSLISSHITGIIVLWFYSLVLFFIGGCIWPLEALPQTVQYLGPYLYPVMLTNQSLIGILYRGWGFDHYVVWIAFVSNILFSITYFSLTVIYSHFRIFKLY